MGTAVPYAATRELPVWNTTVVLITVPKLLNTATYGRLKKGIKSQQEYLYFIKNLII